MVHWVREAIGWIRLYIGGLPWRIANQWLGRDRRTGKMSPRVVLARGGRAADRWEFSALLRGDGVSTKVTHPDGAGAGGGACLPDPIWVGTYGSLVDGAVSRDVAAIAVELGDGSSLHPELLGYGFPARFFVSDVPAEQVATAVAAYDRDGRLLHRVQLLRKPPPTAGDRARLPGQPPQPGLAEQLEVPRTT